MFYGVELTSPTTATGGFIDLYWMSDTSFNMGDTGTGGDADWTNRVGFPSDFTGITDVGEKLVTIAFPGIVDGDDDIFTKSALDIPGPNFILAGYADSYGNISPIPAHGPISSIAMDSELMVLMQTSLMETTLLKN